MKPSGWDSMIRASGSVKLRWALGSGTAPGSPVCSRASASSSAFGRTDGTQPARSGAQRFRQFVAPGVAVAGVLGGVDRLRLGEDARHLGLERRLALGHPSGAHGLVLAGVRLDLGPVEGQPAEPDHACPLAQAEAVEEECREGRQVTAAELADGLVAGTGLAREDHEADITLQALFELARAGHPGGIAIEQDLEHHRRVVRRHPSRLLRARPRATPTR
jgi:hypothetical protein